MELFDQCPRNISANFMNQWVRVGDIVRWSCALKPCSKLNAHLVVLLRSKEMTFHNPVDVSNPTLVAWFLMHEMKVSNLVFNDQLSSPQQLSKLLRLCGHCVKQISFYKNQSDRVYTLIAAYCKTLVKLAATSVEINTTFTDILCCSPTIQHIRFIFVKSTEAGVLDNMQLHRLKFLTVSRVHFQQGFPWSETTFSDTLTYVVISSCFNCVPAVAAIVRNCPQITELGIRSMHWLDSNFQSVELQRLTLVHLDISSCYQITDAAILQIVSKQIGLRSVNCQHCPKLTALSLLHLSDHCASSLEILCIDLRDLHVPLHQGYFEEFCNRALALHTLNINCCGQELCANEGTYYIAKGCPALKTLIVEDTKFNVSSRRLLQMVRPDLEIREQGSYAHFEVLHASL